MGRTPAASGSAAATMPGSAAAGRRPRWGEAAAASVRAARWLASGSPSAVAAGQIGGGGGLLVESGGDGSLPCRRSKGLSPRVQRPACTTVLYYLGRNFDRDYFVGLLFGSSGHVDRPLVLTWTVQQQYYCCA
jgi:hypothetical protein